MVQTFVDLSQEENEKVKELKVKWRLNKPETIRKIIRDFEEEDDER